MRCWRRFLEAGGDVLGDLHARLAELADRSRYFPEEDIAELAREARAAVEGFGGSAPDGVAEGAGVGMLAGIRAFLKDPEAAGERANEAFVERELESSARFFDTVEKRPLTDEQRRAVVVNDRRNLVVASAGSGKTSVIVAKAGWLLSRGFNSPRELLLLAFARDARHEMAGRIGERLGADAEGLTVATFHSLGMSIIREVEGKWPSVAKSAHDSRALQALLTGIVRDLFTDAELSGAVIGWFQGLFGPYRSQHECASWGEYWAYIRRYDIRSLKGERVKSHEECEIANFLYLNGVAYAYGGLYEEQVRKPDGRLYRPAFRLVESGVYIEHFALDEAGEPAGFVDRDAYLHEVKWKRGIHESHGTALVESWSRDAAEGRLLDAVRERLAGCGASLSQVSPAEIFAALEEDGRIEGFVGLVATFLHHFKGRRRVLEEVLAEAEALDDRGRAAALVRLFRAIHERYERELRREGEIDFHDMIDRAADYVEAGRYASRFRYILVDEFQDISPGRARLLNALLDQPPGAQLFAVGDDWQAIFRFGGSDIALMREFEAGFGRASVLKLETTFRCSARIAGVATQFVLKNPAQIEKTVRSGREGGGPGVVVWLRRKKNENLLDEALKRIAEDAGKGDGEAEVLVLSRYRRLRPKDLDALAGRHDGLSVSFKTVHASKGLEADYVIVLGAVHGAARVSGRDRGRSGAGPGAGGAGTVRERGRAPAPLCGDHEGAAPGVSAGGPRRAVVVRPGADGRGLRRGGDRRRGDGDRDVSGVSRGAAAAAREQGARRGVLRLLQLALLRIRAARLRGLRKRADGARGARGAVRGVRGRAGPVSALRGMAGAQEGSLRSVHRLLELAALRAYGALTRSRGRPRDPVGCRAEVSTAYRAARPGNATSGRRPAARACDRGNAVRWGGRGREGRVAVVGCGLPRGGGGCGGLSLETRLAFRQTLHFPAEVVHAGLLGPAVAGRLGEILVELVVGSDEVFVEFLVRASEVVVDSPVDTGGGDQDEGGESDADGDYGADQCEYLGGNMDMSGGSPREVVKRMAN